MGNALKEGKVEVDQGGGVGGWEFAEIVEGDHGYMELNEEEVREMQRGYGAGAYRAAVSKNEIKLFANSVNWRSWGLW